jgi:hypothetical protein
LTVATLGSKPGDGRCRDGGEEVADKADKDAAKFDWVTRRSACTLAKIFTALRLQVEQDVKTRNDLRPDNSPYKFSVAENVGSFSVFLEGKDVRMAVVFNLTEHAILVRDENGNPMFEVTLTFTDAGECRLKVNGEDRESWQVRRMALEELLFAGF